MAMSFFNISAGHPEVASAGGKASVRSSWRPRLCTVAAAGPSSTKPTAGAGGRRGRKPTQQQQQQQQRSAAEAVASAQAEDRGSATEVDSALNEEDQARIDLISEKLETLLSSHGETEEDFVSNDDLVSLLADLDAQAQAQARSAAATGEEELALSRVSRRSRRSAADGPAPGSGLDGGAWSAPPGEIPDEQLPRVAIVGRPNVGKSALFNRIVGRQVAIVYDYPGVTRDRLYTRANWGGREFMLVDTGGLMSEAAKLPREQREAAARSLGAIGLPGAIERQAAAAVEEANVIVLVVDGQGGSTGADEEVVIWLRRVHPNKPVVLAVNKCESPAKAFLQAAEFWTLGAGEPVPVSAISGSGSGELLDRMVAMLPPQAALTGDAGANDGLVSVAIVGRPNVGKSSLLNAIVGKERSIVSPIAGTTRDAIDTDVVDAEGRAFKLIDTAGVRKRTAVASSKDGAEPLSVERAFRALRRAEVAVLVIDATEGITQQDYRLSEAIAAEGRACVIVVNKWDLVPKKTDTTIIDFEANVRAELRMVEWANVVFTSAKTGQRVKKVLDAVTASAEEHRRRISTATLNMVLQEAAAWRAPPSTGLGKRGKVYYGTQAAIKPPTFVLFVNDPNLFSEDYRKYVERQLRENVGFPGTPLRVYWRGKPGNNRYAGTGLK